MYPQSLFSAKKKKTTIIFNLKIIIFTAVKNHSILHGLVIVMFASGELEIGRIIRKPDFCISEKQRCRSATLSHMLISAFG